MTNCQLLQEKRNIFIWLCGTPLQKSNLNGQIIFWQNLPCINNTNKNLFLIVNQLTNSHFYFTDFLLQLKKKKKEVRLDHSVLVLNRLRRTPPNLALPDLSLFSNLPLKMPLFSNSRFRFTTVIVLITDRNCCLRDNCMGTVKC